MLNQAQKSFINVLLAVLKKITIESKEDSLQYDGWKNLNLEKNPLSTTTIACSPNRASNYQKNSFRRHFQSQSTKSDSVSTYLTFILQF